MDSLITGIFTVLGTILGFALERISHYGKIEVIKKDATISTFAGSTIIRMHEGKVVERVKEADEIAGLEVLFDIISLADYNMLLRNIVFKLNNKHYDGVDFYEEYTYNENKYFRSTTNNSLCLNSKEYYTIKVYIPEDVLRMVMKNRVQITMTYKNKKRHRIKISKIDILRMVNETKLN